MCCFYTFALEIKLKWRKIGPTFPQNIVSMIHDSQIMETLLGDCEQLFSKNAFLFCVMKQHFKSKSLTAQSCLFNTLGKILFENSGKRKKMLVTMFSSLSKKNCTICCLPRLSPPTMF